MAAHLWSARKPTSRRALDRTRLMTTASRSCPWNPSTDRTGTPGASVANSSRSTATCALYGVMTAICEAREHIDTEARAHSTAAKQGEAVAQAAHGANTAAVPVVD